MERAKVYFTRKITPDGLITVYKNLGIELDGKVAVKVSTGERGSKGYLKADLIGPLVKSLNGTIVECNTAYRGARTKTSEHLKVAEEHGFTKYAKVDILDSEGEVKIPINVGKHLKFDIIGSHFDNYSSYLNLSHAKGHILAGFGAALKNQAIGFASRNGKAYIHSCGQTTSPTFLWLKKYDQRDFIECMAEAAKAVSDHIREREKDILYISVMNAISLDCDCDKNQGAPVMRDIGILGSSDPVALDQAILDLIWCSQDPGAQHLKERIDAQLGRHITEYAEEIGLGSRDYELVDIDNNKTIHKGDAEQQEVKELDDHEQFGEGLIQKADDVKMF
ncbi:DUF362 domain-containing protein [Candidatus Saccharibacteria bacterium]|nr:DUF362 domain-containing protein [Candidatus Saccharibacteria bacterium]